LIRRPKPSPHAVAVEIEVPFHDVDGLQIVWHGNYCKYLELGRTALLRARQLDALDMLSLRLRFLVTETHIRHLRPLRYADRARVTSWFIETECRIRVACEIRDIGSGRVCAEGETVLVTVADSGELCLATPRDVLRRLMAPGPGSVAED